jgi:hypothetical protein
MPTDSSFSPLLAFLKTVPAIDDRIGTGVYDTGLWWVKFAINIEHPLAWRVVQEFGHILNYISVEEPLPAVFKPVSPPAYMNGGPKEFLSWVVESTDQAFTPAACAEWLEGRLPEPVKDPNAWKLSDKE